MQGSNSVTACNTSVCVHIYTYNIVLYDTHTHSPFQQFLHFLSNRCERVLVLPEPLRASQVAHQHHRPSPPLQDMLDGRQGSHDPGVADREQGFIGDFTLGGGDTFLGIINVCETYKLCKSRTNTCSCPEIESGGF